MLQKEAAFFFFFFYIGGFNVKKDFYWKQKNCKQIIKLHTN